MSDPRPEHTKAITWLNESRLANFYLVKAEAIRIGSSDPACLLTLITGPSEETAKAGDTKEDIADRYVVRRGFGSLFDRARQKTKLYSTLSPTTDNWVAEFSHARHLRNLGRSRGWTFPGGPIDDMTVTIVTAS